MEANYRITNLVADSINGITKIEINGKDLPVVGGEIEENKVATVALLPIFSDNPPTIEVTPTEGKSAMKKATVQLETGACKTFMTWKSDKTGDKLLYLNIGSVFEEIESNPEYILFLNEDTVDTGNISIVRLLDIYSDFTKISNTSFSVKDSEETLVTFTKYDMPH
jgi:hypothetical protein